MYEKYLKNSNTDLVAPSRLPHIHLENIIMSKCAEIRHALIINAFILLGVKDSPLVLLKKNQQNYTELQTLCMMFMLHLIMCRPILMI